MLKYKIHPPLLFCFWTCIYILVFGVSLGQWLGIDNRNSKQGVIKIDRVRGWKNWCLAQLSFHFLITQQHVGGPAALRGSPQTHPPPAIQGCTFLRTFSSACTPELTLWAPEPHGQYRLPPKMQPLLPGYEPQDWCWPQGPGGQGWPRGLTVAPELRRRGWGRWSRGKGVSKLTWRASPCIISRNFSLSRWRLRGVEAGTCWYYFL